MSGGVRQKISEQKTGITEYEEKKKKNKRLVIFNLNSLVLARRVVFINKAEVHTKFETTIDVLNPPLVKTKKSYEMEWCGPVNPQEESLSNPPLSYMKI